MSELGTVNSSPLERNSEYALTLRPDLVIADYQYVIIQILRFTDETDSYVVSQLIIPFQG